MDDPKIIIVIKGGMMYKVIADRQIEIALVDMDLIKEEGEPYPETFDYEPDLIVDDVYSHLINMWE